MIEQFNHLEPERWAQFAADYLDENVRSPISRRVVMDPADPADVVGGQRAYFDQWYVAFEGKDVLQEGIKTFDRLCDYYIIPGMMSMQHHIDCIAPHAVELIFRPVKPAPYSVPWFRTATSHDGSLMSCYLLPRGCDEYAIVFEVQLGFRLKEPVAGLHDFRAKIDEYRQPAHGEVRA